MLLATLIPVSMALSSTGGAKLIAEGVLLVAAYGRAGADHDPVGRDRQRLPDHRADCRDHCVGLRGNSDAFLMAVTLLAANAFLTPIGHQSNMLVMGLGSCKFSDS